MVERAVTQAAEGPAWRWRARIARWSLRAAQYIANALSWFVVGPCARECGAGMGTYGIVCVEKKRREEEGNRVKQISIKVDA
jgi:hypothetical protein